MNQLNEKLNIAIIDSSDTWYAQPKLIYNELVQMGHNVIFLGQPNHLGYNKAEVPTGFIKICIANNLSPIDVFSDKEMQLNHPPLERAFYSEADLVFVGDKTIFLRFFSDRTNSYYMPYAVNNVFKPIKAELKYDIAFIGNLKFNERIRRIELLKKHFNIFISSNHYMDEANTLMNQSKIIFNTCDGKEINMRVFEALGSGRLLVTERVDYLDELFTDKEHLATYSDDFDLIEKLEYYLNNSVERENIAKRGYLEVRKKHTYQNRAKFIIDKILQSGLSYNHKTSYHILNNKNYKDFYEKQSTINLTAQDRIFDFSIPDPDSDGKYDIRNRLKEALKVAKGKVLDIGCQRGGYSYNLKNAGCLVTAIDISLGYVKQAKEKVKEVDFLQANAENMPFKSDTFDSIILSEVLEHVPDEKKVVDEIYKILKPNGCVFISVPAYEDDTEEHVRFLNKRLLASLFKYFSIQFRDNYNLKSTVMIATKKDNENLMLSKQIVHKKTKILLTNHHLLDHRGSEVYTLTLAQHLKQNGCDVVVYSKYVDKLENDFSSLNIQVVTNLYDIANQKFDVAHVHHNINAAEIRYHFPNLPIVFQSHGVIPFLEQPPLLELGISNYLAVSEEVKQNLCKNGIDEKNISIYRNLIDELKFKSTRKINSRPKYALVSSSLIDEQKENIIRSACKELDIDVQFIGGRFGIANQTQLKRLIDKADIVFTLGRGAVEVMLMERIPIIYDYQGGDGLVTVENFEEIMKCNFSGRRYSYEYTVEDLINEISKYDASQVTKLREKAQYYYSADRLSKELIELYKMVASNQIPEPDEKTSMQLNYFIKSIEETRDYSFKRAERNITCLASTKNNFNQTISYVDEELIELLVTVDKLIDNKDYDNARKIIEENNNEAYIQLLLSRAAKLEILAGNLLYGNLIIASISEAPNNSKYLNDLRKLLNEKHEELKSSVNHNSKISTKKLLEADKFIEKNNLEEAEKLLLDVLNIEFQHIEALNNLAVIYILKEDYKSATNLILYLLKIDPENEVALGNLNFIQEQISHSQELISKNETNSEVIVSEDWESENSQIEYVLMNKNELNFPTQSEKKINLASSLFRQADYFFSVNNLNSAEFLLHKALTFIKSNSEFENLSLTEIQQEYKNKQFAHSANPKIDAYEEWLIINEMTAEEFQKIKVESEQFKYQPLISIVTPVYNVDPGWLFSCVNSVLSQIYSNWEFCLVDDGSTNKETLNALNQIEKLDSRIKVKFEEINKGISAASNTALSMARGEFIALLDNDDELTIDALHEIVKLLNKNKEADFIYSDEDKIDIDGKRCEPFFKPDWSLELFRSYSYTCHISVFRKSFIDEIGGFRNEFSGAQDYDITLRAIERTKNIFHIPKILYHWRKIPGSAADVIDAKGWALIAAKRALEDHLVRTQIEAEVKKSESIPGCFRVKYKIKGNPLVSILLPTRGQMQGKSEDELLFKCVESIVSKTEYSNYEILIGYNNTLESKIQNFLKAYPHRAINYKLNGEFNFANKINFMAKHARGEHLVIFNDDLEVIAGEWLSSLLEFSQQEEVGVVGSKLLFPDGKLQHVGMVLGINGYPAHIYHSAKPDFPGYRGDANLIRNYSAVTGAAMMVKKKLFDELKGLDENFRIDYNDTDFCMRVLEKGYRNVYTPYSLFYHHESAALSSGRLNKKETELFQNKWKKYLNNDPFYNPNLTKKALDYSLDLCPV